MLVDNAIVVTDGMRMRIDKGEDPSEAARAVVGQTATPLLGATAVAIAAFAAIGTSQDATGEYTRSLFSVILISLTMSWFTAVTITPLMCKVFLKPSANAGSDKDPYAGGFYQMYRRFLELAIDNRVLSITLTLILFGSSIIGFGYVKHSFFPDSTRPQFYVDAWFPEGTNIAETEAQLKQVEEQLLNYQGVTHVTTQIGGGSPRFLLTYSPEQSYPNFGRILVDAENYSAIEALSKQIQTDLESGPVDANFNVKLFVLGPATGGKIQLRISGSDKEELRKLAATAKAVIASHPNVKGLRDEWGDKVKTLRPRVSDTAMRRLGIDRQGVADAMAYSGEGLASGVFRDNDELLPIISRAPEQERTNLSNLDQLLVWSPIAQQMIPIGQVVPDFDIAFENPHIWRRDRVAMLRLHFDQRSGLSSDLLADIKADIEKALNVDVAQKLGLPEDAEIEHNSATIPVKFRDRLYLKDKPGYYVAWGGENEDADKGSTAIAGSVPVFFGLMVFIIIALFNSIKKTLVIWLVVPLALVGVTVGLLMFQQPFGFMALLGFMSLAGMLIKNAIVLVDQIGFELESGKEPFTAVVESGVSRLIPVSMAALTTILGMIPLLGDAFFIAMAVTIMFGLGFATVLTLVVVPVLYATLFGFHRKH
jgi:multidrug efflux pump subunit AcrB